MPSATVLPAFAVPATVTTSPVPSELALGGPRQAPPTPGRPTPPVPAPAPRDELFDSIAALIASGEAWVPVPVTAAPVEHHLPVQALPVQALPLPAAPSHSVPAQTSPAEAHSARVSFGFRDGTTAVLAQDSDQAAALEELAALLSLRD